MAELSGSCQEGTRSWQDMGWRLAWFRGGDFLGQGGWRSGAVMCIPVP